MKWNSQTARSAFLLSAACSASLLEMAPLLTALQAEQPLLVVLLLGLAYQVGNAVARHVGKSQKLISLIAIIGLVGWLLADQRIWLQLLSVAAMSAALQAARRAIAGDAHTSKIPTATKRSFRVAGFILAALAPSAAAMGTTAAITVFGAVLLASIAPKHKGHVITQPVNAPLRRLQWHLCTLMVMHQTHYFVYAYAVVYLAFKLSPDNALAASVSFALGWITYLSAEKLWKKFPDTHVFVAGHSLLAVCLFGMSWAGESWVAVALWVLTGIGGGTVYCLTSISEKAGLSSDQIENAEDIGHVGGLVLAIALVVGVRGGVSDLTLAGACLAAVAAMMLLGLYKRSPLQALLSEFNYRRES
ncbi:hypothetical protein [Hydrogenophaga sp.]